MNGRIVEIRGLVRASHLDLPGAQYNYQRQLPSILLVLLNLFFLCDLVQHLLLAAILSDVVLSDLFDGSKTSPLEQASSASGILSRARRAKEDR
jgi:hypothetical protein